MTEIALVALEGAYVSSVGAMLDSYGLACDRIIQTLNPSASSVIIDTQLKRVSLDGHPVNLADGSSFAVEGDLSSISECKFIWLPSFRAGSRAAIAKRIETSRPLLNWLQDHHARGTLIGASGASVFLMMAAHISDDMPIPMPRALGPLARELFPRYREELRLNIVEHNNILIGKGIANDLALISRAFDHTIAPEIARWLNAIIGLRRSENTILAKDPMVANAQIWLEQHFTDQPSISGLAETLAISHVTLIRRFRKVLGVTPLQYVQQLRLNAAKRMLHESNRSIDQIASLLGFSDSRTFREMFKARVGLSASAWRKNAPNDKQSQV